jgi:hypothetical protein
MPAVGISVADVVGTIFNWLLAESGVKVIAELRGEPGAGPAGCIEAV